MPHTLTIEVSASKALWLHQAAHWEWGLARFNSQIILEHRLGDHVCLRPKPGQKLLCW